jgi:SAM-dependent methyltransferase
VNTVHQINSRQYWDERFGGDWQQNAGYEQTAFFANLMLDHLPAAFLDSVRDRQLTICDFGCAAGQAVHAWSTRLGTTELIEGVDFSPAAIEHARQLFPRYRFRVADVDALDTYDIIFSSNTLEHTPAPTKLLNQLADKARAFVLLLLPYQETRPLHAEHRVSFQAGSFPMIIGRSRVLIWAKVIDTRDTGQWPGFQVLLMYANPALVSLHRVSLAHLRGEAPLEAAVLGTTPGWPSESLPDSEHRLAAEVRSLSIEMSDLRHQLDAANHEAAAARAAAHSAETERVEESQVDRRRVAELEAARAEVKLLRMTKEAMDSEICRQRARVEILLSEMSLRLEALERENEWMKNSRSWRITRPLREMMAMKRRVDSIRRSWVPTAFRNILTRLERR